MIHSMSLKCLLHDIEGCVLIPYQGKTDKTGISTIGIGHVISSKVPDKNLTFVTGLGTADVTEITYEQADELLKLDLIDRESILNDLIEVPINQSQFDALLSFGFNIGMLGTAQRHGLRESLVLKYINEKEFKKAGDAMLKWRLTDGSINQGLVNRRHVERLMLISPTDDIDKFELSEKDYNRVVELITRYKWNLSKENSNTEVS